MYNRANWEGIESVMTEFHQDMLKSLKYDSLSTEELWTEFTHLKQRAVNSFLENKPEAQTNSHVSTNSSNVYIGKETIQETKTHSKVKI